MTINIRSKIDSIIAGRLTVERFLEKYHESLDRHAADTAAEIMDAAIASKDAVRAVISGVLASEIYFLTGDLRSSLLRQVDVEQVRLMMSDSEPDYYGVFERCLEIAEHAEEASIRDVQFRASVVAADAAFFTAELTKGNEAIGSSLLELANAASCAQFEKVQVWTLRFISLSAAVSYEVTKRVWPEAGEQETIDSACVVLASALERIVPDNFAYPTDFPDGPENTVLHLRVLSDLSQRYGSSKKALAWLDHCIHLSE